MYTQIGQFGSVRPFCYIILAIHLKLMSKVLSGSANHHRRLPDHSTSGDKLVKSGHWSSLTSSSLPPQFWESTHGVPWLFPVSDSGNHSTKCENFHLPDTRSRVKQDGPESFQIHNMTAKEAAEEGWVHTQQPDPTLVREAADKCSWYRRLMPSNLVSAWLLLTGDNQDERICWAFYIFKCLQSEAFFSVNLKWKFIPFLPNKVISLEKAHQDLTICFNKFRMLVDI